MVYKVGDKVAVADTMGHSESHEYSLSIFFPLPCFAPTNKEKA